LIQSGGAVQSSPKDPFSKRELAENCRHVAEKVTFYNICYSAYPLFYLVLFPLGSTGSGTKSDIKKSEAVLSFTRAIMVIKTLKPYSYVSSKLFTSF